MSCWQSLPYALKAKKGFKTKRSFFIMKINKIGIIVLCFFCSYVVHAQEGPIQKNDIEQLRQQRQFNKDHFYSVIKDLQSCIKMSQSISSQLVSSMKKYQQRVEEVQKKCHSQKITTTKEFELCWHSQDYLLNEIYNLIAYLPLSQRACSRTQYSDLISSLETLAKKIEEHTSVTRTRYLTFVRIQQDRATAENRKKKHPHSIKSPCYIRVLSHISKVHEWHLTAQVSIAMGDMYDLKRAQTALNILKDEISLLTKICDIHNKTEIAEVEETVQKAQTYKKPFIEMAQKICGYLDQQNPANKELCQEPLNNDSWKYSVSQALKTQTKETNEGEAK